MQPTVQRSIDRRDNATRRRATLHATSTSVPATRGCPQLLASSEAMASFLGWAHCCHICTGTRLALPHLHRDSAHPCHICTGTAATSAPELGRRAASSAVAAPVANPSIHRRPARPIGHTLRRRSQCPPTDCAIHSSVRCGGVVQHVSLGPRATAKLTFILSWHFPNRSVRSAPQRSRCGADRIALAPARACVVVRVRACTRAHSLCLL